MQASNIIPVSSEVEYTQLSELLDEMMGQIAALQGLVSEDQAGDSAGRFTPDLPALRRGLSELGETAGALLLELQATEESLAHLALPDLPVGEMIARLVEEAAEALDLSSRIAVSGEARPVGDEIARLLYRIAQELLRELQQHTGTRRLRFTFNYGRDDIQMTLEDDGIPFNSRESVAPTPPVGNENEGPATPLLKNLRGRLERLGGSLEITSNIEQGTRVLLKAPYGETPRDMERKNTPLALPPLDTGTATLQPERMGQPINPPGRGRTLVGNGTIRVLVVDNQAVTRAGLRRLLESYADLTVVGEASDGVQAVSETLELGPQVVLMDTQLPQDQALETLRQIQQLNLDTRVLLLSGEEREDLLYEALREGAGGYVLKDIEPDELAQAVRSVAKGDVLVQPQLAGRVLSRFSRPAAGGQTGAGRYGSYLQDALTAREQEVLQLLARGLRNKEIAARLFVSERTVNFHLANIYSKLNVSGRTEALSKAIEQGLVRSNH